MPGHSTLWGSSFQGKRAVGSGHGIHVVAWRDSDLHQTPARAPRNISAGPRTQTFACALSMTSAYIASIAVCVKAHQRCAAPDRAAGLRQPFENSGRNGKSSSSAASCATREVAGARTLHLAELEFPRKKSRWLRPRHSHRGLPQTPAHAPRNASAGPRTQTFACALSMTSACIASIAVCVKAHMASTMCCTKHGQITSL